MHALALAHVLPNYPLRWRCFSRPTFSPDEVVQIALWTDVVGHCANDVRAAGTAPSRVLREGGEMMAARLRFLGVQSDPARAVIRRIRAAL